MYKYIIPNKTNKTENIYWKVSLNGLIQILKEISIPLYTKTIYVYIYIYTIIRTWMHTDILNFIYEYTSVHKGL